MNATGLDVEIEDVSDAAAGLALQGKLSREVLEAATRPGLVRTCATSGVGAPTIGGVDVDVTRTGYTGDLGYELWIPAEGALAVWDRALRGRRRLRHPAGGDPGPGRLPPRGEPDPDRGRVHERPPRVRPEHKYSPFEIGLGRLVKFDKAAEFTGQRALLAEREAGGPARRLVGLELDWSGDRGDVSRGTAWRREISPLVQRAPVPVYKDGVQVGRATSVGWGTDDQEDGRASARSTRGSRRLGTRLSVEWTVEGERGKVGATVVPMPFLDLDREARLASQNSPSCREKRPRSVTMGPRRTR